MSEVKTLQLKLGSIVRIKGLPDSPTFAVVAFVAGLPKLIYVDKKGILRDCTFYPESLELVEDEE